MEDYNKAPTADITVMGDSWMRLLIAPTGSSPSKPTFYRNMLLEAGASRLYRIIEAALSHRKDIQMEHRFIPADPQNQYEATSLLQEYPKDPVFSKNIGENIENPFRMQRDFGKGELSGWENSFTYEPLADPLGLSAERRLWVIYDQEDYSEDLQPFKDKEKLCKTLRQQVADGRIDPNGPAGVEPNLVFWSPRDFGYRGNDDTPVKDEHFPFKQLLFEAFPTTDGAQDNKTTPPLGEKTIVFLRMDRLTNNGIGRRDDRSIDWCMRGILQEFQFNGQMRDLLSKCKAIVITCGVDFAFLIQKDRSSTEIPLATLFFRPIRTCNYYRDDLGFIRVYGPLMLASCVRCVVENVQDTNNDDEIIAALEKGIEDGLWRMLLQYQIGYPIRSDAEAQKVYFKHYVNLYKYKIPDSSENAVEKELPYVIRKVVLSDASDPSNAVTQTERNSKNMFLQWWPWLKDKKTATAGESDSSTKSESPPENSNGTPLSSSRDFNLLNQQWAKLPPEEQDLFLWNLVRDGLTLMNQRKEIEFPIARFGKLRVIDPDEVELLRDMQILIRKYLADEWGKPLGIAVFGEPGSGKSFGIKQIVNTICGPESKTGVELIECNLAQFTSSSDLAKELHRAQDAAIARRIPLIFLDEFDSVFEDRPYGWFKYLLSLLQDGTFKLGDSIYHLGKSIVVCAGGMNHSFEEFDLSNPSKEGMRDDSLKKKINLFRDAKGPDLVSRLRGSLDVKGPNPVRGTKEEMNSLYKIRRAVILRSILKNKMKSIFSERRARINPAVLHALLDIPEYYHGTRSIEAVIEMSVATYRDFNSFEPAMIPPASQLNIHLNGKEFYELMEAYRKKNGI